MYRFFSISPIILECYTNFVNPDEAFFVRCDRTTMTQDDIEYGRLICVMGLATTKPTEFIIFRLAQTKSGSDYVMLD